MRRLTKAQRAALDLALEGDIYRWPGGFWALNNEPISHRSGAFEVPRRYIAAGTIYALDRKRFLREIGVGKTHPWSGPRRITDAARAALQAEKGEG